MGIIDASEGYFNSNNEWVNQGKVSLGNRWSGSVSISIEPGTTLRLTREDTGEPKPTIYQAELAHLAGGLDMGSSINSIGFAGNGHVELPSTGGASINWKNIDGLSGGNKTIRIRYSHGGAKPSKLMLVINDNIQFINLQPTGSWDTYKYFTITTPLKSGAGNTIRLETADNVIRIDRVAYYEPAGNIDELQIF